jgi:hypothetical protein
VIPFIGTRPSFRLANPSSWRNVLDVYPIAESDKAHFQVIGFRQTSGGRHHAFQSLGIGRDQRGVFTGRELCLSDGFLASLVDVGHEPKPIDALDAIRSSDLEINLVLMRWQTESCRQTQRRQVWDDSHSITLRNLEIVGTMKLP